MKLRIILTLIAVGICVLIYMFEEANSPSIPDNNGGGVVVQQ